MVTDMSNHTTTETTIDMSARKADLMLRTIENWAADGATSRKKIAEEMISGTLGGLWTHGWESVALGELTWEILAHKAHPEFEITDAVRSLVERTETSLLKGWMEGNSTNQLSNAMDGFRRSAARRFIKQMKPLLAA